MSIPGRLFNISKAYLNQVRDRIDHELSDAERELDSDSASRPGESSAGSGGSDADSMIQRAEERIAAARRDLESRTEMARAREASGTVTPEPTAASQAAATTASRTAAAVDTTDPNYHDYRVLGVPVGSDLSTIQAKYETLSKRSDPRQFPDGSAEQKQADQILGHVNAAYEALRQRLDPMTNRFGKLELE